MGVPVNESVNVDLNKTKIRTFCVWITIEKYEFSFSQLMLQPIFLFLIKKEECNSRQVEVKYIAVAQLTQGSALMMKKSTLPKTSPETQEFTVQFSEQHEI